MPSRRQPSTPAQPSSPPQPRSCFSRIMPSLFNTIRASIYGVVFLFTWICLAMAAHFQNVLSASDLTRFVPFAIFVCVVSLIMVLVLLGASYFMRERNPISTRIELACLGLWGIFWLVLGVYLATSAAQHADVECFSSTSSNVVLDDSAASFHTEQYQAMYRVLMVFSIFNAILVLFALFALLYLAVRRHQKGDEHMWYGPVTSCAWFNDYGNGSKVKRGNSNSSSILPITATREVVSDEKPRSGSRRQYQSRTTAAAAAAAAAANVYPARTQRSNYYQSEKPLPPPKSSRTRHQQHRSADTSLDSEEFETGGMMNPARRGGR